MIESPVTVTRVNGKIQFKDNCLRREMKLVINRSTNFSNR